MTVNEYKETACATANAGPVEDEGKAILQPLHQPQEAANGHNNDEHLLGRVLAGN